MDFGTHWIHAVAEQLVAFSSLPACDFHRYVAEILQHYLAVPVSLAVICFLYQ